MISQERIKKSIIQHWPQISDHSYRILILSSYGSEKTNVLPNQIHHQENDDDIIYKMYCMPRIYTSPVSIFNQQT